MLFRSKNDYDGSYEQIGSRADRQEAVEWVREQMDSYETAHSGTAPQAAD